MEKKCQSKQTEIGTIPGEWAKKTVGDFVDIKHGYAFKGEYFTEDPTKKVVLTPGNFHIGGGFKTDKLKFTTEDAPTEYILHEGDVIVTMTDLSKNGDTLGYAAKVPPSQIVKYLHNQRIGLLKFKSKEILPEFLYWILRTKRYNLFVVGSASGSTVKHTSPDRIKAFSFGLPPSLLEQNAVAGFLSKLDLRISLNQQVNRTLEAIGAAVFRRWFVDFEFPDEKGKPYKSSGGKIVYNDELEKEIPKGWKVGCIEDVANVLGGGTPSRKVKSYFTSNGISWLTPKDLSGYEEKFIEKGATDLTEEGLKNSSAKTMPKGTILFTSRAPIGYIAIALNNIATNQGFKSLVPKNNMKSEYLYHFIKKITPYIKSISSGSTFGEVTGSTMKRMKILIPEYGTLETFEDLMRPINSKILNNIFSARNLTRVRDLLLPKLMSGTIRVPIDENNVEVTSCLK